MNYFTKEELEWISRTIGYYQSDGGLNIDEIPICDSVFEKIQSMIDNYCDQSECDHVFDGKFYDLLGDECNVGHAIYFKVKCKKCGEFYR